MGGRRRNVKIQGYYGFVHYYNERVMYTVM